MKQIRVALGVSLALIGTGVAHAADAWLGTWKLNVTKSKYSPGTAPKSGISRLERVEGGAVKVTSDGVDARGSSTHTEILTRFDGKPGKLKGTNPPVTLAFSRIDDHNYEFVTRVDGKVAATSRVSIAADGKTRTLVTTVVAADGKSATSTIVYDRQ